MKNAEKIANVAKQMIGVCNVIINLAEAEENKTYDEMLWDELSHTQKLVLEFTKFAFEEEAIDESVEDTGAVDVTNDNFDEAFFGGELDDKKGVEEKGIVIDLEEEEDDLEEGYENKVPKGIDK